jgi:hypothetical protein
MISELRFKGTRTKGQLTFGMESLSHFWGLKATGCVDKINWKTAKLRKMKNWRIGGVENESLAWESRWKKSDPLNSCERGKTEKRKEI